MYISGPEEAPSRFLSRISSYVNDANPLSSVVLFNNKDVAIRKIWLKGLLQPYLDIADLLEKDMPIATLVLSVRNQGAARLKLAHFKSHATAMRAFFLSRRYSPYHLHMLKRNGTLDPIYGHGDSLDTHHQMLGPPTQPWTCLLYTSPSPRDRG